MAEETKVSWQVYWNRIYSAILGVGAVWAIWFVAAALDDRFFALSLWEMILVTASSLILSMYVIKAMEDEE